MKTLALSLLALTLSTSAFACPVINGNFSKKEVNGDRTETITFSIRTEVNGSTHSYDLSGDGPALPADGVAKRIERDGESGTVTLSCSGNQLVAAISVDGKGSMQMSYTKLSETQLQIEGTGEAAAANGIYTKE